MFANVHHDKSITFSKVFFGKKVLLRMSCSDTKENEESGYEKSIYLELVPWPIWSVW